MGKKIAYILAVLMPPIGVWIATQSIEKMVKSNVLCIVFGGLFGGLGLLCLASPVLFLLWITPIIYAVREVSRHYDSTWGCKPRQIVIDGMLADEDEIHTEFGKVPEWLGEGEEKGASR